MKNDLDTRGGVHPPVLAPGEVLLHCTGTVRLEVHKSLVKPGLRLALASTYLAYPEVFPLIRRHPHLTGSLTLEMSKHSSASRGFSSCLLGLPGCWIQRCGDVCYGAGVSSLWAQSPRQPQQRRGMWIVETCLWTLGPSCLKKSCFHCQVVA